MLSDDAFHLVGADDAVHTFRAADLIVVERGRQVMLGNIAHGCLVDVVEETGAKNSIRRPSSSHGNLDVHT